MDIQILSTAYPYRGGIAVFNERLAKEFSSKGDQISIKTFTLQYPNFLFPGKSQFTNLEYGGHVKITRELNSINPLNWVKVGNKIRDERPDILILKYWIPFMAPCLGTVSRIVRKNNHTKVIVVVDNIIPHEKRVGDKLLSKFFVKSVDGFVCMSKQVFNDLEKFDSKINKINSYHPIYDNFGKSITKQQSITNLKLNGDYKHILFFGIIRKYKGLDLLIKAFSRLKHEKIRLIIAGEFYDNQDYYLDLIQSLGLDDSIILKNEFIPDNMVVNYFCSCDIVAQPYKSATQSGVTQIAYHFEKPMLVTDVGGLAEIVKHGVSGYVCSPDVDSVYQSLNNFFKNNRYDEFVSGVKQEKKRFSWNKLVSDIKKLHKDL